MGGRCEELSEVLAQGSSHRRRRWNLPEWEAWAARDARPRPLEVAGCELSLPRSPSREPVEQARAAEAAFSAVHPEVPFRSYHLLRRYKGWVLGQAAGMVTVEAMDRAEGSRLFRLPLPFRAWDGALAPAAVAAEAAPPLESALDWAPCLRRWQAAEARVPVPAPGPATAAEHPLAHPAATTPPLQVAPAAARDQPAERNRVLPLRTVPTFPRPRPWMCPCASSDW